MINFNDIIKRLAADGDRTTLRILGQLHESTSGIATVDAEDALEALADALRDALSALPADEYDNSQLMYLDGSMWRRVGAREATALGVLRTNPLAAHVLRAIELGKEPRRDFMRMDIANTRILQDGRVALAEFRS